MTKENMMTDADAELLRLCDAMQALGGSSLDLVITAARESVRLRVELDDERAKVGILMQPVPEVHGDFPWQMMRLWCANRDVEKREQRESEKNLRADVARLKAEKEAAYTALEGRLGCGDDDAGKTQKVLWACEAHVLAEDALPGDEFDSEDYSLPKAVAALVKQRDGERDENERLRADVARLREALKKVVAVSADRERFVMQGPRGFAVAERIAKEVLAATDPETRS